MSKGVDSLSPMQQEVLSRADAIMSSVGSAVEKASDLAIEGGRAVAQQIPDIAFQYIAFGRASITAYIVMALVVMAVSYHLIVNIAIKDVKKMGMYYGTDAWAEGRSAALVAGAVFLFASFMVFAHNLKSFFLVWFAPKIWLLTEVVNLIKTVKG